MRNRTKHEHSWLTAISDAGSTPAASTIIFQIYKIHFANHTIARIHSREM
jgi:hypothetical protein